MRRKPKLQALSKGSLWRCGLHAHCDAIETEETALWGINPMGLGLASIWSGMGGKKEGGDAWGKGCSGWNGDVRWELRCIVNACGYEGEDKGPCDGPRMSFEIGELGVHLVVEKGVDCLSSLGLGS